MTTTTTVCTTLSGPLTEPAALALEAAASAGARPSRALASDADRILADVSTFLRGAAAIRPAPKPKKPTAPKTTTTTSLPKELAFLKNTQMSVQEKVYRLLLYFQEKSDKELEEKLKEYSGKVKTTTTENGSGGASEKKGSMLDSLFGVVRSVLPGLGLVSQLMQNPLGGKFLQQLGGPAFAAAATALGFPELAPLLSKLGPQVVDGLVQASSSLSPDSLLSLLGDGGGTERSAASSSGNASGKTTTTETSEADEKKLAVELQWLMQRQQAMTAALSATLKVMHDTNMAVIHNIR